jgi:superfamily I DNA/RNA helicase
MLIYSKYQQAIFDWIQNINYDPTLHTGENHLVVEAAPGSGKTFSIVEAVKFIPQNKKVILVSFSKLIADTLATKIPRWCESSTLNAYGWRICRDNIKGVRLDKFKDANIYKNYVNENEWYKTKNLVQRLIGLLKNNLVIDNIIENMLNTVKVNGLELPEKMPRFNEIFESVYTQSCNIKEIMSFDDQKFAPIYYKMPFITYNYCFVDELQDISELDSKLIEGIIGDNGHLIGVGDANQCQPAGTIIDVIIKENEKGSYGKVIVTIEKKPIEEIKIGDKVISYDIYKSVWTRDKEVQKISSRLFKGNLIKVKTENNFISRYTPGHKCVANFINLMNSYVVYIMEKNGLYRIGKCKLVYGNNYHQGPGIFERMRNEAADTIWILSIHDTDKEAQLQEKRLSMQFDISQLMFRARYPKNSKITQSDLDYIWSFSEDKKENIKKCLKEFGRLLKYPIFTTNRIKYKSWFKSPNIIHACNLLDGCLMLPYDVEAGLYPKNITTRSHSDDWIPITVEREYYEGPVYSLLIKRDETYVADGLLTHNSIYAFRGSLPNAMEKTIIKFNAKRLPLSYCYRCPTAVINEAKKIYDDIEHPEVNANGEGIVETISKNKYEQLVQENDYVLCRTTAPLIKYCLRMLVLGKRAFVKGREIGDGLIKLIDKVSSENDGLDLKEFQIRLDNYYEDRLAQLNKLNRETEATLLEDQVESLKALLPSCTSVNGLKNLIDDIIVDNGVGICYMTLHKSKGLEARNVFIIRRDLIPHKLAKTNDQLTQENNLLFIGITRSQSTLRYVEKDRGEK